jgi:phosphoglycolate phosphatase
MRRRFDLLVFDWDGTLMDSAACIAGALQCACEDLGYPVPSDRDARYIIGLNMSDALAHILPEVPASEYPRIAERYRHHFLRGDADTALFAGVPEMLQELRANGYRLAVATGKSRRGLDRALEATGLAAHFEATRCADEGHTKPDPGMLHCLLDTTGVGAEHALMIGDTTHDMAMAQAAGIARLAVTHGAHEMDALLRYEPLACVRDCVEMRAWIARHG